MVDFVTTNCRNCREIISVPVELFNTRCTASHRDINLSCPEVKRSIEFESPDLAHAVSAIVELAQRVHRDAETIRALMELNESRHSR